MHLGLKYTQIKKRRIDLNILKMLEQAFLEQQELMLRLVLACILGIAVGFERTNRNKMAGIRTHAVVMFGSALIMIVSKYGFSDVVAYDGSRIASQIVSGVGFLGAGMIFVKDDKSISGLTTAAGIWAATGIGMCVGAGQYMLAITSTVLLILMQELLHRVRFLSHAHYHMNVEIYVKKEMDIDELQKCLKKEKAVIEALSITSCDEEKSRIEMDLIFSKRASKLKLVNRLSKLTEAISVKG